MPYIKKEDRRNYEEPLNQLIDLLEFHKHHPGHMNFIVSYLINECVKEEGKSYTNLSKWIGALECAKLEIYRKLIAPYEDKKCEENGEVFK